MLEIRNLSKSYGTKKAVDNLTFSVDAGDNCAFIGHNGAGKTTTLKCAAGILAFDEGEILIDGVSIASDPLTAKRKFAYIPDNPDLYDYMTGMQYLNFISDIFGLSKEERRESI